MTPSESVYNIDVYSSKPEISEVNIIEKESKTVS